jgi:DNA-directed RNA polymerase beta' subunit
MISIIDVNQYIRENKLSGPITSPQLFIGKTMSFHPQGLFSEEIFGMDGSPERKSSISWINLNCDVIHPALYDSLLKRIERKINIILSGETLFKITDEGELVEDENGEINGYSSFVKNIHRIKFRMNDDGGERDRIIEMMHKNISSGLFFTDKIFVISPDNRPISVGENVRDVLIDEMNEIYQRVIILSNQIKGVSGTMYDIMSYKMQLAIKDLYEFVKVKVAKKEGIIRNLMLGKRVDFSSRLVITPNPHLKIGEVGIPLVIICSIFEPQMLYALVNSPEAKRIPKEFHESLKEFLGKELDPELIL